MGAWEKDQGTAGTIVKMLADPSGAFTRACDMIMDAPGPASDGIIGRCKRWAMHVVDGEVKGVAIAESEFDPAGDDFPEKTLAPALIEMASAKV